jgi:hypothetical protein
MISLLLTTEWGKKNVPKALTLGALLDIILLSVIVDAIGGQ